MFLPYIRQTDLEKQSARVGKAAEVCFAEAGQLTASLLNQSADSSGGRASRQGTRLVLSTELSSKSLESRTRACHLFSSLVPPGHYSSSLAGVRACAWHQTD